MPNIIIRAFNTDLESVSNALQHAKLYGLEAEVITTAIRSLQSGISDNILTALSEAFIEWDI